MITGLMKWIYYASPIGWLCDREKHRLCWELTMQEYREASRGRAELRDLASET